MEEGRRETERREQQTWRERLELLVNVSAVLEPIMVVLGIVFLGLFLMEFTGVPLVLFGQNRMASVMQAIWWMFLGEFILRLLIAPDKVMFLRSNVLGALSLALPFLYPLCVPGGAGTGRAPRGFSLWRFLGGITPAMRALRRITRGRQMAFAGTLTVAVVTVGAVGVVLFDHGIRDRPSAPSRTRCGGRRRS